MSEWIKLGDLKSGSLFEFQDGDIAVKSEYHYANGTSKCVLLGSGEYAHPADGDNALVKEIEIQKRTL